ncbi:hypothetical protein ACWEQV_28605, partial [Rhodococcus aetherivorans]
LSVEDSQSNPEGPISHRHRAKSPAKNSNQQKNTDHHRRKNAAASNDHLTTPHRLDTMVGV